MNYHYECEKPFQGKMWLIKQSTCTCRLVISSKVFAKREKKIAFLYLAKCVAIYQTKFTSDKFFDFTCFRLVYFGLLELLWAKCWLTQNIIFRACVGYSVGSEPWWSVLILNVHRGENKEELLCFRCGFVLCYCPMSRFSFSSFLKFPPGHSSMYQSYFKSRVRRMMMGELFQEKPTEPRVGC